MKKPISILLLLVVIFLNFEELQACVNAPPTPPAVILQRYSSTTACITICNYTSFGADSTNFCICALNSVSPIISVDALSITDTNNVPIPGFPFVYNANTGPSFDTLQNGNWEGFLSDVSQIIPAGVPVKIIIMVTIPPNSSLVNQLDVLASNLAALSFMLANDEGTSSGTVTNHHLQFKPAGTITVVNGVGPVDLLDENQALISSHNNIEDAYNAIPATLTQSYFIEILPSYVATNEVYPVTLPLKSGHSADNTVTIRPAIGNTGEIISSSNSAGIIIIDNADYIIIDGRPGGIGTVPDLEIRNTVTSGTSANTIALINGATNCIIRYVKSYNATAGSTGPKNISFKTSVSNPTGNSDNLVEQCYISGGRTGVCSEGTTANPNFNNVVRNNEIVDWGFNGIWFLNASAGMTVEGNTIYNTTGVSITNPSAINIQSTYDGYNLIIRNNKITNVVSTSTSTSLVMRGINTVTSPGTGSVLSIYNNFIALNSNNNNCANTFGIYTTGTIESHTVNIFNNTIVIGGTQTGGTAGNLISACIVKQSSIAGVVYNQRNNVCVNNRTGGTPGVIHAGCAINGIEGTLDIDYNSYYASGSSDGTNSYPASWDSTEYDDISAYIAVSGETNVRFKNTNFVSSTDLHITGASLGDPDLSGRPITGITTDIDGDTRNTEFPYRGADEAGVAFTLSTLNLTVNLEACSPMQDTVRVLIRNTASPYSIVEESQKYLSVTGTASLNYAKAVNGVSYYLVVRHRNSIQTWSKAGGEVFTAGILNYDFTTAASQAFGSNQVLVSGEYSIYTADPNQDDIVDGSDGSMIDNDAAAFATGYVVTDLNCDGIVDGSDGLFAENNAANFVGAAIP